MAKPKHIDERELVSKVIAGNRKAFEQLVHQYENLVLHIVTPLIGVNADREDICQDVFIKVYEKLNQFEFKSSLATWIGRIAYNTSLSFLQKKRNVLIADLVSKSESDPEGNTESVQHEWKDAEPDPEQVLVRREEIHLVRKAIDLLPGLQKTILLLFHQDEMSLEEIQQVMDIPVNTIKSHLFRARKSLKQMLMNTIQP